MNPRSVSLGRLATVLFLAAVAAHYAWTPASFHARWLTPQPTDYYHELADGFLAGQLHLPRTPDPRLVGLTDPYDPAANAPYRINDLSYHSGRYYLYHSAVPALVLFAPVKLFTGNHLGLAPATWVFCLAGTVAAVLLLLRLREDFFPLCPRLLVAASVVSYAFGQGYHVVVRSGTVNQVPIASAYCFLMLALLGLRRALLPGPSAWRWLGLASLCYGLAIASRPNYVFGTVVLLVPVFLLWRTDGFRFSTSLLRPLLAAGTPVTLVLVSLLVYNAARFGDPLEFGMRYMLGAWDQRTLPPLGLGNLGINAHHYFVAPSRFHLQFPFVTAPSWQATGLLWHNPFVWLLLLLPMAFRPAASAGRPGPGALLFVLGCAAGTNLLTLLLLPSGNAAAVLTSANARYVLDFQPALMLLACVGVLAAGDRLAFRAWPRRLLTGLASGLALLSVAAGLSLDFQRYPPEAYRPLARQLSRPAWWLEKIRGIEYGPVDLEVLLPADKIGAYEPLLTTGTAQAGELLYIFYEAPGQIRLGLVGSESLGPASGPIAVDFAQPHRFTLHLGSLNPPVTHPSMAAFDEAQVATLKRRLLVQIDGRTVFTAPAYFHPNDGARPEVGRASFLRAYAQEEFTGRIISTARQPVAPPAGLEVSPPGFGPLRLRVTFPTDRTGVTEPLLSSGIPQAGDLLHVTYRADGAVRFGLDHWGHRGLLSDWLVLDPRGEHVIEFSSPSLYPPDRHTLLADLSPDGRRALKERLRLTIDGRVVFDDRFPAYESSPYDVVPGRNAIGSSSSVYGFTGRILESSRLPFPPATR